jgi:hypothetical protein
MPGFNVRQEHVSAFLTIRGSDSSSHFLTKPLFRVGLTHSVWNYQKRFTVSGERRRFLN